MSDDCRVVVCDDVADYRLLIVTLLERVDGMCVVGEAGDGQAAVDVAAEQQPDIVLLDVSMPGMDGLEALPLIRAAAPESRVIMLTGYASSDIRERAMQRGAVAYIEKGLRPALLMDAIRAACAAN